MVFIIYTYNTSVWPWLALYIISPSRIYTTREWNWNEEWEYHFLVSVSEWIWKKYSTWKYMVPHNSNSQEQILFLYCTQLLGIILCSRYTQILWMMHFSRKTIFCIHTRGQVRFSYTWYTGICQLMFVPISTIILWSNILYVT